MKGTIRFAVGFLLAVSVTFPNSMFFEFLTLGVGLALAWSGMAAMIEESK